MSTARGIGLLLTMLLSGGEAMASVIASSGSLGDLPAAALERLGRTVIYFGHQSVGFNVIEGLELIKKEQPAIKLQIARITAPEEITAPMLAHSVVGENSSSRSKIAAFAEFMNRGAGTRVEIAFFKLCFVDITRGTDITKVFEEYRSTMAELRRRYPRVRLVHATVPLTSTEPLWRKALNALLGKEDNNVRRQQYNELIRRNYEGNEPVFDIARAESTYPDGTREAFQQNGMTYYALVPSYTDDGGHLNKEGEKAVAWHLLRLLASVASEAGEAR